MLKNKINKKKKKMKLIIKNKHQVSLNKILLFLLKNQYGAKENIQRINNHPNKKHKVTLIKTKNNKKSLKMKELLLKNVQ